MGTPKPRSRAPSTRNTRLHSPPSKNQLTHETIEVEVDSCTGRTSTKATQMKARAGCHRSTPQISGDHYKEQIRASKKGSRHGHLSRPLSPVPPPSCLQRNLRSPRHLCSSSVQQTRLLCRPEDRTGVGDKYGVMEPMMPGINRSSVERRTIYTY